MTLNNFDEAVTFHVHNTGTSEGALYYYLEDDEGIPVINIGLSELYPEEEQIEVRRVFDFDTIDELKSDPPTAEETRTLQTLRDSANFGSPMYTVNSEEKRITFSTDPDDYIWKDGVHHTRGGDIQLSVWNSETDTTIISRRSDSTRAKMVWTVGTKVTARSLNVQTEQMLNLAQELRTIELNPQYFDDSLGATSGVCPLDGNGVIPLKHIPIELGGQGYLYVDLTTYTISDLGNVDTDAMDTPVEGDVLTFTNIGEGTHRWISRMPLAGVIDLSEAPHLGTLIWEDDSVTPGAMKWTLRRVGLNDMSNVNAPSPGLELGNILFFNEATETWVPSVNELHTGTLLDTFGTATFTVDGDGDVSLLHGQRFILIDSAGVGKVYEFDTGSTATGSTIGIQGIGIEGITDRIADSINVHKETLDILAAVSCPVKNEYGNYDVVITQQTTGVAGNTPIVAYNGGAVLTIPSAFTGGSDGTYYENSLTPLHILVWDMANSQWKAELRPDIVYDVFDLRTTNLDSLADVWYQVDGDGNEARVDGDILTWFTNKTSGGRWRDQSFDTWDMNNWWSGGKLNDDGDGLGLPGEPGWSDGYRAAALWKFYGPGDVPYWDRKLPQADEYNYPAFWRGSFHVGPPLAGGRNPVTDEPHIRFDLASNYDVVKWHKERMQDLDPPDGHPGSGSNDDTSHWEMGRLNLNHLGDVHARVYQFQTYPNAGGPSYKPDTNAILVWWDGADYDATDPNTGPSHDAWIVKEGVDLGQTLPGDFNTYKTTHTFDMKISDANIGYGPGNSFAGIWMDMYRFSYTRSSLIGWEIYQNGRATSRVRLFKTNSSNWNNLVFTNITDNGGWTGSDQNASNHVLGGGQGSAAGFRHKKKTASNNFILHNGAVMGSADSPDFSKDDILVCELENFNATNGDPTNLLTLVLEWRIEVT